MPLLFQVSIYSYLTSAYIHCSFEWLLYNPEEQVKHASDFLAAASASQMSILWAMLILYASFNASNYRRFSAVQYFPTRTLWSPIVIFLLHLFFINRVRFSSLQRQISSISDTVSLPLQDQTCFCLFVPLARYVCMSNLYLLWLKSSIDATFQRDFFCKRDITWFANKPWKLHDGMQSLVFFFNSG